MIRLGFVLLLLLAACGDVKPAAPLTSESPSAAHDVARITAEPRLRLVVYPAVRPAVTGSRAQYWSPGEDRDSISVMASGLQRGGVAAVSLSLGVARLTYEEALGLAEAPSDSRVRWITAAAPWSAEAGRAGDELLYLRPSELDRMAGATLREGEYITRLIVRVRLQDGRELREELELLPSV